MKRNILLILEHPSENSFCNALFAYKKGAESIDAECKTIYIARLNFNVNLADGYKTGAAMEQEEDLVASQRKSNDQESRTSNNVILLRPNHQVLLATCIGLNKSIISKH